MPYETCASSYQKVTSARPMGHSKHTPAASAETKAPTVFDPTQTVSYQARLRRAPRWFSSFLASNSREKNRLRKELSTIRDAVPLLMKQRNGEKWTQQERAELVRMLRSASAVSPYLLLMALPGSTLLLPFLAWHLDARRKKKRAQRPASNV